MNARFALSLWGRERDGERKSLRGDKTELFDVSSLNDLNKYNKQWSLYFVWSLLWSDVNNSCLCELCVALRDSYILFHVSWASPRTCSLLFSLDFFPIFSCFSRDVLFAKIPEKVNVIFALHRLLRLMKPELKRIRMFLQSRFKKGECSISVSLWVWQCALGRRKSQNASHSRVVKSLNQRQIASFRSIWHYHGRCSKQGSFAVLNEIADLLSKAMNNMAAAVFNEISSTSFTTEFLQQTSWTSVQLDTCIYMLSSLHFSFSVCCHIGKHGLTTSTGIRLHAKMFRVCHCMHSLVQEKWIKCI